MNPLKAEILCGDCIEKLKELEPESVDCCVTSPPYFGLRDYEHEKQIGREESPDQYIEKLVEVFRSVRRVLKPEGTLWLNLGDCYASDSRWLKPKDLMGMPWRVALALQTDGWWLRQDIIWHKPNSMPESVRDRCVASHEYIFLLSKAKNYYFDSEAIKETMSEESKARLRRGVSGENKLVNGARGQTPNTIHKPRERDPLKEIPDKRNKRSVWNVTTKNYSDAHFAVFPTDLVIPCVQAGCPERGVVLDPFSGSGTTGEAAQSQGRGYILIELNHSFCEIIRNRLCQSYLSF